ncbi:hypothetical protein WG947_01065 [Pontibacter sp. H259]|uniref:hypothetical protein n=1 Tax=Pontibacter sp. H259 TaxID=3133421 RepID=UPI0030BE6F7D
MRSAVLLLIALLLVSLQQQVFRNLYPDTLTTSQKTEKQLTLKQSTDTAYHEGIVHDDPQQAPALLLAFALILALFGVIKLSPSAAFVPFILSRNACCIVPKGP